MEVVGWEIRVTSSKLCKSRYSQNRFSSLSEEWDGVNSPLFCSGMQGCVRGGDRSTIPVKIPMRKKIVDGQHGTKIKMIAIPSSFHHSAGNEKDEASTDGEIVRGRETQDNSAREGWAAKANRRDASSLTNRGEVELIQSASVITQPILFAPFPFRGTLEGTGWLQPLGTHFTATKDGTDGSAKPSPCLPEGRQKDFGTSVEADILPDYALYLSPRGINAIPLHWRDYPLTLFLTHLPFSAPHEANAYPGNCDENDDTHHLHLPGFGVNPGPACGELRRLSPLYNADAYWMAGTWLWLRHASLHISISRTFSACTSVAPGMEHVLYRFHSDVTLSPGEIEHWPTDVPNSSHQDDPEALRCTMIHVPPGGDPDLRWVTAFPYAVFRTKCYYKPLLSPIDGGQMIPRVFAN
ncbi:hypothetical protein PCH_Pc22g12810 [Penicillium rubens Wisconsin 54-1255]|uniref:Uncharacterized protein n=1 Tax=Penicillium rubens (strain ATCC 28089 / DSM 1075 / NRRL 1951 / Wisconsin 54-1255) TaxID=500485 RepID=B6HSC1_PENRW|nr:hypothetical protein PCH_Pc22g12810 [Penicillium rubens Wisconsin 54-1255]